MTGNLDTVVEHDFKNDFNSENENVGLFADLLKEVLWMCNADATQFLYLNAAFETVWGMSKEEIFQNPESWSKAIHPDDVDRVMKSFGKTALKGLEYHEEYRIVRPDGEIRYVIDNGFPFFDDNGLQFVCGTMFDVTKRKKIEEELQLAQKLEAVGQLSAGIAHEINTPSQYVGDNLRFLSDGFTDIQKALQAYNGLLQAAKNDSINKELIEKTEEIIEDADLEYLNEEFPLAIEQALEGIGSISHIVRAMKEFSHPGSEDKEETDINHLIKNTLVICKNQWKYVADAETHLDENITSVPIYAQTLGQVLLNLVINAAHAIEEKRDKTGDKSMGKITLSTFNYDDKIEIHIKDSGCGIPAKNLDKIFNPFFTTKEVGKGTGQGLSMAYTTIVEQHHGTIECESLVGQGTTFKIGLPLATS